MEEQQQQPEETLTKEQLEAQALREKAELTRKQQALKMNLARIREQMERTTNERYRQMLSAEMEHLQTALNSLS